MSAAYSVSMTKSRVHHFLTGEAVEIGVNEGASNFAGAVGAEIHENQRIAVFHRRVGLFLRRG